MEVINYDFSSFLTAFKNLKEATTVNPEDLITLKHELNTFFKDSSCKEVFYTKNDDKMFFGIKVYPIIDAENIYEYILEDEPILIRSYMVEMDSQIFNPIMDLSEEELLSMLIYEVNRLVGDSNPVEKARDTLNYYLAANNESIRVSSSIHYKEILAFGLKDYLSKNGSMFYCDDESEIYASEFAMMYGLDVSLISAYEKVTHNNMKLYENSAVSKFIVFNWALSVYKNIKIRRIGAIKTLERAKQLTACRIERTEMENLIRRIKRIDDDVLMEDAGIVSAIKLKLRDKVRKSRTNTMRSIDGIYFELSMQVKNVEDEEDALYLMRQINSNIAIIEEYSQSDDCDDYEKAKWMQLLEKFKKLRENLTNQTVYKNKNYGLFVTYPDIVDNRY